MQEFQSRLGAPHVALEACLSELAAQYGVEAHAGLPLLERLGINRITRITRPRSLINRRKQKKRTLRRPNT